MPDLNNFLGMKAMRVSVELPAILRNCSVILLSYIEGAAAELVYDGDEAVGRSDAERLECR